MSSLEIPYCTLTFSSKAEVFEEPENYLIAIDGEIRDYDDNDDYRLAGRIRAYYAALEDAGNNGLDPFYILDMQSSTAPFYHALFDSKTRQLKDSVNRFFAYEIFGIDLLILDRLEIIPEYRGRRLGLACLYRCIQQFWHGAGLVVLKPFPLQFENNGDENKWRESLDLGKFGKHLKPSRSKLEKYYALLGFEKLPRTEIMAMCPTLIQPTLKDFGFQ